MIKKRVIYILFFAFLAISLASADETTICKNTYYFIIDHLDYKGGFSYTDSEIDSLSNKISIEQNELINSSQVKNYLNNYDLLCNFTNLTIPVPSSSVPYLNDSETNIKCNPYINNSILGIDADFSIDFMNINVGKISCSSIDSWKWILKYDVNNGNYTLKGIKVYLIVVVLIIAVIIFILWAISRDINYFKKK